MKDRAFDLEERLIEFAVNIIQVSDSLPETRVGNHIRGQLLRCGTSAAPNYAEAQRRGVSRRFPAQDQDCPQRIA